ncbi:MAG TPA: hypothetical protein VNE67_11870 [Acetobacteraceae bacterium]|nr:hypothetical protein [Acetobacteraceae bacterium]
MASEPEAAADAAARLEAALERIARLAAAAATGRPTDHALPADPSERASLGEGPSRVALVARLDRIIERLRGALDQGI